MKIDERIRQRGDTNNPRIMEIDGDNQNNEAQGYHLKQNEVVNSTRDSVTSENDLSSKLASQSQ